MKKSETKKFIAVIDPKAAISTYFVYKELNAKNLIEAISEANKYMDENVYLIDLYEKQAGGDKEKVFYKPVLRNRGSGWNIEEQESYLMGNLAFWYKYHDDRFAVNCTDFEWGY